MKKSSLIILATVSLVAAGNANAAASADICSGATVATNGTAVAADSAMFVKQTFNTKCSANVSMAYSQDGLNFAVGAGSSKGKTVFAGNTSGGAVSSAGTCSTSAGCVITDAQTAAQTSLDSLT